MSAARAYQKLGPYTVHLVDAVADGHYLGKRAILRDPTPDDPEVRVFGIVSEDYNLITPEDICSIFDEHVGKPIETIAALGHGEIFFVSTHLPNFGVKGDEIEDYLLLANPMTGLGSAEVRRTPVRAVCQNTLTLSENMATQRWRVVHGHDAKVRLAQWVREMYEEAETMTKILKDLFELMASHSVKTREAQKMFEYAYPTPGKPKHTGTAAAMNLRIQWWEENVNLIERRREGAKMLFEGMGTGMDVPAAKGTLWGAYNAVVETEDYRRTTREHSVGDSALFGERAKSKRRAFEYAVDQVK
jgi:hypothetical protein